MLRMFLRAFFGRRHRCYSRWCADLNIAHVIGEWISQPIRYLLEAANRRPCNDNFLGTVSRYFQNEPLDKKCLEGCCCTVAVKHAS
jgi:hypothetical protein